jgi:hypothetical protein
VSGANTLPNRRQQPDDRPPRKSDGSKPARGKNRPAKRRPIERAQTTIRVERASGGKTWQLVHPACVQERAEDLDQVRSMLAAGEVDVARDELLWLLEGCRDFIEAHKLLGEIAAGDDDVKLARAHFGYAWQMGATALPAGGLDAPLIYSLPANQPFLEAGKGLAWALCKLERRDRARPVLELLLACDPSDPLGVRTMLAECS